MKRGPLLLFAVTCDCKKLKPVNRERHAPLSVKIEFELIHNRKAIFSVKNVLPKTHDVSKATRSSVAFNDNNNK